MSESESEYARVDAPRADETREWEVFLREEPSEPLRHAGSVTAPTVETAREQATTLFGWSAAALWLCPADEVARFAERTLAAEAGGEAEP